MKNNDKLNEEVMLYISQLEQNPDADLPMPDDDDFCFAFLNYIIMHFNDMHYAVINQFITTLLERYYVDRQYLYLITNYLSTKTVSTYTFYLCALAYYNCGYCETAITLFKRFFKSMKLKEDDVFELLDDEELFEPMYFKAIILMADAYCQLSDDDRFLALITRLLCCENLPAEYKAFVLCIFAGYYRCNGEYEKAIGYAEKALQLEPDNCMAHFESGYCKHQLGLDCLADFDAVLESDQDENYFNAFVYKYLGDENAAQSAIDDHLNLSKDFGYKYYFLAEMYSLEGKTESSADCLAKAFLTGIPYRSFLYDDPALAQFRKNGGKAIIKNYLGDIERRDKLIARLYR
jgi:tetratricopeptide (TPR) repeat protein